MHGWLLAHLCPSSDSLLGGREFYYTTLTLNCLCAVLCLVWFLYCFNDVGYDGNVWSDYFEIVDNNAVLMVQRNYNKSLVFKRLFLIFP